MFRRHKRQRTAADAGAVTTEDGNWSDLIDDTLSTIDLLRSRNAAGFAAYDLPPLLLWHQLYTILPNRTFVDQSVNRLRNNSILVTFKIPTGNADRAIIRMTDYIAELEKWQRVLRSQQEQHPDDDGVSAKLTALAMLRRTLPRLCPLPTISLRMFIEENLAFNNQGNANETTLDEKAVRTAVKWLQRLGFMLQTVRLDDETYQLSIPGVGKLVTAVKKTRTMLLSTLKRTKYKEVAEQQLKKSKLKHSSFELEYHLADMEGCGLVHRTKVTSGTLVTLIEKDS